MGPFILAPAEGFISHPLAINVRLKSDFLINLESNEKCDKDKYFLEKCHQHSFPLQKLIT